MSRPNEEAPPYPGNPALKTWYTLRQWATLTEQRFYTVQRQADRGTLKTGRLGNKSNGKRVVYIATIAADNPDLYASLAMMAQRRHRG